jgi:type IV pilus assembly protein PilN
MRLDINLATRPYEDARKFWARWGLGVGLLGILTLLLLIFTVNEWRKAGKDRQEIAGLQAQIAERDRERSQDQAVLDQPGNRSTRDQSQFVNGLIQRKSFSWTRVFEDLEQVMPPNLHVVSLRPELNEQDQMQLDMKVAGDNRSAAIELVHRMEGSKHFQGAQLMSESQEGGNGSNIVVASVIAIYVPDVVPDVVPGVVPGAADTADRSNK